MIHLLVLAVALSACVAETEPQVSSSPHTILVQNNHLHRLEQHRLHEEIARLRGQLHRLQERYRDGRHHDDRHRDDHNGGHWSERRDEHYDREDPEGPVILRSIRPDAHGHHTPDIAGQNKIIADVYSPDYAEPTWVLDYRYLKTGGRDYTRGPGGQIIILPKGIHTNEQKEFKNYDDFIEHLRLKNLAERKKPQYFMPLGERASDDEHEGHRARKHDERGWWKH